MNNDPEPNDPSELVAIACIWLVLVMALVLCIVLSGAKYSP